MTDATLSAAAACARCGTELAPRLLACPGCRVLLHAARLTELAADAERAERAEELEAAMQRWRDALDLLPPDAPQRAVIDERLSALGRRVDARAIAGGGVPTGAPWWRRGWGVAAALALFALGKGKLLLLGLTKASTVWSMLAFMGVYWERWGWTFAIGMVLSIYVHEMGHVAALRRYGIAASAPMFIPGIGAFVRLNQLPSDARQDARIGLAGPVWGLGAALAAYAAHRLDAGPVLAAIAQMAAWVNLFNLIPIWQLDGGRGFNALARAERWVAVAAIALAWALTREGLLILLLLPAGWRAFTAAPTEGDRGALALYVALVGAFTWLTTIPVPVLPR